MILYITNDEQNITTKRKYKLVSLDNNKFFEEPIIGFVDNDSNIKKLIKHDDIIIINFMYRLLYTEYIHNKVIIPLPILTKSIEYPHMFFRLNFSRLDWNTQYMKQIKYAIKHNNDKYTILFFGLNPTIDKTGHANIIIIDNSIKCAYHYDPMGQNILFTSNIYMDIYTKLCLCTKLEDLFSKIGINYYSIFDCCPRLGPQYITEKDENIKMTEIEKNNIGIGWCSIWILCFLNIFLDKINNIDVNITEKTEKNKIIKNIIVNSTEIMCSLDNKNGCASNQSKYDSLIVLRNKYLQNTNHSIKKLINENNDKFKLDSIIKINNDQQEEILFYGDSDDDFNDDF